MQAASLLLTFLASAQPNYQRPVPSQKPTLPVGIPRIFQPCSEPHDEPSTRCCKDDGIFGFPLLIHRRSFGSFFTVVWCDPVERYSVSSQTKHRGTIESIHVVGFSSQQLSCRAAGEDNYQPGTEATFERCLLICSGSREDVEVYTVSPCLWSVVCIDPHCLYTLSSISTFILFDIIKLGASVECNITCQVNKSVADRFR